MMLFINLFTYELFLKRYFKELLQFNYNIQQIFDKYISKIIQNHQDISIESINEEFTKFQSSDHTK